MDLLLKFREYQKEKHREIKVEGNILISSVSIGDSKPKQETESPKETASENQNLETKPATIAEFTESKATSNLAIGQINRFQLECWLNANRPDLLAAVRAAEAEAERAWFYAEAGFPDRLAAAEAALAQAVAEGREAIREALEAGQKDAVQQSEPEETSEPAVAPGADNIMQDPARELDFKEVDRLFGGFERVWQLSGAQAEKMEKIFREKGSVVVQTPNKRWWSAQEWSVE